MAWTVEYRDVAKKSLKLIRKGNPQLAQQIADQIEALATNPYPGGVEKLGGKENLYRIRVRTFRVVYSVEKKMLLVLIIDIGPRGDIYDKIH